MRENVKIIIVTYNSADCIAACLDSLKNASERLKLSVTIVDNASTDDTLAIINSVMNEANDCIEIIRNPENLGYAQANNVAINAMCSEEPQYSAVLILNPDVTLTPGAIDKLLSVLLGANDVGAVCPYIVEPEQSPNRAARMKSLWGWPMRKRFMGYENVIEVDRLHGACMLVQPGLFKEIGVFDESYFLYWEEIDLCQRAKKSGFRLLLHGDVVATHRGNSTSGQCQAHRIYYMWRNQFYFSFKNYRRITGMAFLVRRFLSNLREFMSFLRSGRLDLCAAGLAGMLAGILGEKSRSANLYAQAGRLGENRNHTQRV